MRRREREGNCYGIGRRASRLSSLWNWPRTKTRTIVFTPEQFPALRVHNPKPWWPYQMGEPHLEHLTVSFVEQGVKTDEQSVDFGIREITSELTSNGSRLFRVNGKPILIRGAGWSQDMLLRTDERASARPDPHGARHESQHHPP